MLVPIVLERNQECTAGTQRYVCSGNQFNGCCSVDPCDLPACPDISATQTMDLSAISSFSRLFQSSISYPGVSDTTSESNTPSSTYYSSQNLLSSTFAKSASVAAQVTSTSVQPITTGSSSPSESAAPLSAQTTSPVPIAKIAGGAVGASAAVAIVLAVIYLLYRRKRETQRRVATLPPSYDEEGIAANLAEKFSSSSRRSQRRTSISSVLPFNEEKTDFRCGGDDVEDDAVPHLDGTPVKLTLEMATNPVGSIAELPAVPAAIARASGSNEKVKKGDGEAMRSKNMRKERKLGMEKKGMHSML